MICDCCGADAPRLFDDPKDTTKKMCIDCRRVIVLGSCTAERATQVATYLTARDTPAP